MTKNLRKCSLQNSSTQTAATVCMRRTPTKVVPRAAATVTYYRCRLIPCPQFNHRMNPHIQMEYTNIGRIAANLLLACSFDFLEVVKVLLNGKTIRNCLKVLLGSGRKIGTHKGSPAIFIPSLRSRAGLTNNQNQHRQRYPQVAIDELGSIRTNRWVTMNTSTLNLRAIPFSWTVIDAHQNSVVFSINQIYHKFKQHSRNCFSFLTDRTDEIIERFISLVNTSGPEPTGDGFSAIGKNDSCDDYAQSPCRALMQNTVKSYDQDLPAIRENPFVIHSLAFSNVLLFSTKHIGQDGPFLLQYCFLKS